MSRRAVLDLAATGGHRLDAPYARGVVEASAARGVVPESGLGCTVVPV